jgi:hypothetical protein
MVALVIIQGQQPIIIFIITSAAAASCSATAGHPPDPHLMSAQACHLREFQDRKFSLATVFQQ